ncbi:MAG: sodium:proton antiporter [Actinomycetaceae bacterium]|nr:sodium:proton antiporter [Arcanobacterium sp.]MDD7505691.1 sodium:proton antiporter [Actinomycetaceae bacterium]MDY6142691.1 sodium:proton antiporter [Arcanobacterium sp.]
MLVVIIGLLAITVLCVTLGDKLGLPYPILMMLCAIALSFLPGVSAPNIDPDLILPLFLPPLLFATARNASWSVFRKRWSILLALAVLLTIVTALVAALLAWWLVPGITFPLALLIGAAVAPTDPVAVEAVAGPAKMPRRLMILLDAEGLFNDAIAIVMFQTALGAVIAQQKSISPMILVEFPLAAAGSVLVGLLVGYLYRVADRVTHSTSAQIAVSIVAPFAAYMLADYLGISGVIAVVVTALESNRNDRPENGSIRIARNNFWDVANVLINGLAFGLIGLQMREVFAADTSGLSYALPTAAVCASLFLVRYIFVFVLGKASTRLPLKELHNGAVLLTWSGMRGLATLALALAVPSIGTLGDGSSARQLVIVIAATTIFVTLVPTGFSLPWLSRRIAPQEPGEESKEIAKILRKSQHQSLMAVSKAFPGDQFTPELRKILQVRFDTLREELEVAELMQDDDSSPTAYDYQLPRDARLHHQAHVERMVNVALNAARAEVLRARRDIDVDPEIADRILLLLDQRMMAAYTSAMSFDNEQNSHNHD